MSATHISGLRGHASGTGGGRRRDAPGVLQGRADSLGLSRGPAESEDGCRQPVLGATEPAAVRGKASRGSRADSRKSSPVRSPSEATVGMKGSFRIKRVPHREGDPVDRRAPTASFSKAKQVQQFGKMFLSFLNTYKKI